MGALCSTTESHIKACFHSQFADDLGASAKDDDFVSYTLFGCRIAKLLQILVMDVVMADDGTCKNGICMRLDGRIHKLLHWYGCAQVNGFHSVLFDSAVLDVYDFTKTDGVLIASDSSCYDLHRVLFDFFSDFIVREHFRLLRNDKVFGIQ